MIAANGLFLLADQELSVLNATGAAYYTNAAIKVYIPYHPDVLATYLRTQIISDNTKLAWAPSWQSLLSNGTVNNPQHNNLTGIVYGK